MALFWLVVITPTGIALADSHPGDSSSNVQVVVSVLPGTLSYQVANPTLVSSSDGMNTVKLPITIIDARGSGAGWSLSMNSLASSATGYEIESTDLSSMPHVLLSYPVMHYGVIMNAGVDSGMGTIHVTLTLLIPDSETFIDFSLTGGIN